MNRGLEGLAAAIVKLWEKSEIAKIAVKRGIQNTNHERMAEQLKVGKTFSSLLSPEEHILNINGALCYSYEPRKSPMAAAFYCIRQWLVSIFQLVTMGLHSFLVYRTACL